jgi:hypothetical protein
MRREEDTGQPDPEESEEGMAPPLLVAEALPLGLCVVAQEDMGMNGLMNCCELYTRCARSTIEDEAFVASPDLA